MGNETTEIRCQTAWSLKLTHAPCASPRICNQCVSLRAWLNVCVVSLRLSMVICMCTVVYSQVCWTPWRARGVRGVRDVSVLGCARTRGIGRAQVAGVLWTGCVVYSVSDATCNNLRCTSFLQWIYVVSFPNWMCTKTSQLNLSTKLGQIRGCQGYPDHGGPGLSPLNMSRQP